MLWTYQENIVGNLPLSCEVGECVSRCHEFGTQITACCGEGGIWDMASEVEKCPHLCDQVLDYSATCEEEAAGFADTDTLDQVPKFDQPDLGSMQFPSPTEMPDNLKVVFLGDGGSERGAYDVYEAAAAWGPDFVVYNADLDYGTRDGNPEMWMKNFESYFGEDMPMFATIGNHDSCMWFENNSFGISPAWETVLEERYARLGQSDHCEGVIGVNNVCFYKGLLMLESGIGELSGQNDPSYTSFAEAAFEQYPDYGWKLMSMHKNQRELQLCTKPDSNGYDIYEIARKYGAIINNAHEHSYARTHTLGDLSSASALENGIVDLGNDVRVGNGTTFVFVNGLAGFSVRNECLGFGDRPWWASWAAGNGNKGPDLQPPSQGTSYGFMGCTFKPNGVADRADCFFEDVQGRRFDEYSIFTFGTFTANVTTRG